MLNELVTPHDSLTWTGMTFVSAPAEGAGLLSPECGTFEHSPSSWSPRTPAGCSRNAPAVHPAWCHPPPRTSCGAGRGNSDPDEAWNIKNRRRLTMKTNKVFTAPPWNMAEMFKLTGCIWVPLCWVCTYTCHSFHHTPGQQNPQYRTDNLHTGTQTHTCTGKHRYSLLKGSESNISFCLFYYRCTFMSQKQP